MLFNVKITKLELSFLYEGYFAVRFNLLNKDGNMNKLY